MGGLLATAAGVQATAASWTDSVEFAATVRSANTTTTSTTTTSPSTTTSSTTTTSTSMPTTTTSSTTSTSTTTSSTSTPSTSSTTTTAPPPPPSISSGGISAASPETVITGIGWTQPDAKGFCTDVSVTGISSTPWDWAIQIDLTAAPWYGTRPQHVSVRGTGTTTTLSSSLVLVTGRSNGGPWDPVKNNTPITNAQTAVVTICTQTPPVPTPADPSWYTVTAAPQIATNSEACVLVTATPTDLATGPFFFGWTATIDLTAAKAALIAAGGTPKKVSWSPQPNGAPGYSVTPSDFNTPLDTYTIASGYDYALRAGAGPKAVTVCVSGK
jgi:hypothetical protein